MTREAISEVMRERRFLIAPPVPFRLAGRVPGHSAAGGDAERRLDRPRRQPRDSRLWGNCLRADLSGFVTMAR